MREIVNNNKKRKVSQVPILKLNRHEHSQISISN